MRGKTLSIRLKVALAILAVTLFVTGIAASQERVLGNFRPNSGARPVGGLIFDSAGNLYGTTSQRGLGGNGFGTVFELTPNEGGGWTQKALHNFHDTTDGFSPQGSLVMDTAGNLYGAAAGGVHGYGTVFDLTSVGSGRWTFKTLYSFSKNGVDGTYPQTGVILDAAGNLYGTTLSGGTYDSGTVFELTPSPRGSWTEKTLHSFNGVDGAYPTAGLIFDAAGNLYGTTWSSSTHAYGVVFELTPVGGGSWTEIVLHSFINDGSDGLSPYEGVIFDTSGNLYGTTRFGGAYGEGTVFELTPAPDGSWTEMVLHNFNLDGKDGARPYLSGLVFGATGNLYGTTSIGGVYGLGTAFELTPMPDGSWTETVLHSFNHDGGRDGDTPVGGMIFDAAGNLYGVTLSGGKYVCGVVFEITP